MRTMNSGGPAARNRTRNEFDPANFGAGSEIDEPPEPKSGSLLRVLLVVVLLHVLGIGGVLLFKMLNRGESGLETEKLVSTEIEKPAPITEGQRATAETILPPRPKSSGKPIIVDHPNLKGHVRYRVGSEEEDLVGISRKFNASVAEVEGLNSLRSGEQLYEGQWLTVPDRRTEVPDDLLAIRPTPVSEKPVVASLPEKEVARPAPEIKVTPPLRPAVAEAPKPKPLPLPPAPQPSTSRPIPAVPVAPPTPRPAPSEARTYKVKAGDTAYRIALKYGITWQVLLEHNGVSDPTKLQVGQVLRIPEA
ncbi:MAG: LysM peptidoglycan-binding domain-containing protein [Verrucomicrobiota bacterium]